MHVDHYSSTSRFRLVRFISQYRYLLWMMCALVASLAPVAASFASDKPDARVLFINSYNRGYAWSDGIEQGVRETFDASGKNIELSFEYLDSVRYKDDALVARLVQAIPIRYPNKLDLLMVSDNAAFEFAIAHRKDLFAGVPIVFCGVNRFRPEIINGIDGVTGVNEELDAFGAIDLALKVQPNTRNLIFISTPTLTPRFQQFDSVEEPIKTRYGKQYDVTYLKDVSLKAAQETIEKMPKESVLFLIGLVRDDKDGRLLTPIENARQLSSITHFPTYAFWSDLANTGVMGLHVNSPNGQGIKAAEMGLQILRGAPTSTIPVVMASPVEGIFDYKVMTRFGIDVSDLPKNSKIINRPYSLWDNYEWEILGLTLFFFIETVVIIMLARATRERRIAMSELARERALLESRVHERTEELQLLNQRLELMSFTDELTQLANRRRFDEVLEAEFLRARRSKAPLSLLLIDVDYFKRFNDTYGHVAGDECLERIARVMQRTVNRSTDLAARYGGEEFAVILPETNASGAHAIAQRICGEIATLDFSAYADALRDVSPTNECLERIDAVTVSIGVITARQTLLGTSTDLIRMADEQLYFAKKNGRNRICAGEI
jgi:diguanylate cyclase (GGDEF)-like protein